VLAGKYHVLPRIQGLKFQNYLLATKSFGSMANFKYLVITLAIKGAFVKELKSSLISGYTCYYSVQNLLFSSFLLKNTKIKIRRSAVLPVILFGLREEHRLRVFENKVLRKIFGPKWDDVIGEWRELHNKVFHDLYCSPNTILQIKSRPMRWRGYVAHSGASSS
jgi:hypothetical protein